MPTSTTTDFVNPSYLSGPQISYPTEFNIHLDNTLSRVSHSNGSSISSNATLKLHEELSHFFSEHLFFSPTTDQRFTTLKAQIPHSGYSSMPLDRGLVATAPDSWALPPAATPSAPLAILTSGFEPFEHRAVMNHGRVTPGYSPKDPRALLCESAKAAPTTRR